MDQAGQDYLAALKQARSGEDSSEQPQQADQTEQLEETTPIDEVAETDNDEVATEIEEQAEQVEGKDEEGELFYEIDGEQVSGTQLKEYMQGGLRQSDYTTKTQSLADERRTFESERQAKIESIDRDRAKLSEQLAVLEAMVAQEALTDEELKDLREYEPEKYINHIEKQQKRSSLIKEAKTNATPKADIQAEQAKMVANNPQWLSDGKPTESYEKDMNDLQSYYTDKGFTQEQVNAVNGNALLAQAVLDAARFKSLSTKKDVSLKQVRKAPAITKPRAQTNTAKANDIARLEAIVKKGGMAGGRAFAQLQKLKKGK